MSDWRRRQRARERRRAGPGAIRLEVATAGNPVRALLGALSSVEHRPGLVSVGVHHDDGCPAIAAENMSRCSCEIVALELRRLDLEAAG